MTEFTNKVAASNLHPNTSQPPSIKFANIVVIGAGYVGLSNAILLAQDRLDTQVLLFDIN